MLAASVSLPKSAAGRRRLLVLGVALAMTAVKLVLAWRTIGSNDALHFRDFADYVHRYGPIGIYGHWSIPAPNHSVLPPYNHPPAVGWMLSAINLVTHSGLDIFFVIKLPAVFSDLISALLVFELVRERKSLTAATGAGLVVALSPVLFVISGFHANTDPVFVMFSMLGFYLLHKGRSSVLAGLCFGLAISIKLVPVVVFPILLVLAWRGGRRRLAGFVGGAGTVFVLLWVPVIIKQWTPFKVNVLEYAGYGEPRWGILHFLSLAGAPHSVIDLIQGPGRFVVIAVSAGLPALIAWRRPEHSTIAFGLTLSTFLLLSTATATQYLAWAAAPAVLVSVWFGGLYNLTAGALLIQVYNGWNLGAWPWAWDRAYAMRLSSHQTLAAGGVWLILLAVVVTGLWYTWRSRPTAEPPVGSSGEDGGNQVEAEADAVPPASARTSRIASA